MPIIALFKDFHQDLSCSGVKIPFSNQSYIPMKLRMTFSLCNLDIYITDFFFLLDVSLMVCIQKIKIR